MDQRILKHNQNCNRLKRAGAGVSWGMGRGSFHGEEHARLELLRRPLGEVEPRRYNKQEVIVVMSDESDEEPGPTPADIIAQALGQLAEFVQEAVEAEAFDPASTPNAHNNALLASMAMCGYVQRIIASDYVEANMCMAELMSATFGALQIPRRQQGHTAAGMIDGINASKEPQVRAPSPIEVSQFGRWKESGGRGRRPRQ